METLLILVAIAAALAVTSFLIARRTEKNHPPVGQFIEVDSVRLHYIERGQGQPIVLLHGNGSMIQDFESSGLIDKVASRYRVIVFDRPGYGHSTRPRGTSWNHRQQATLIFHALQQLSIDKPIIVGHSWGTLVALALAVQYPSYPRSLVLLSGYYFPTFRLDVFLLSPPAIPVIGDVIRYTISPFLGRLMWPGVLRAIFGPNSVPHKFDQFPVWMALRPSQLRASASESAWMISAAADLSRHYQTLSIPIMIMAGNGDHVVNPQRHASHLNTVLPRSELKLVPETGHMIHHIATDTVAAAIDWIAKQPEVERRSHPRENKSPQTSDMGFAH